MTEKPTTSPFEGTERPSYSIVTAAKENLFDFVVEELRREPASINIQGKADFTALHWAACNRNLDLARLLVEQTEVPANLFLKDIRGRTPLDHAVHRGSLPITRLLFAAMYPDTDVQISK